MTAPKKKIVLLGATGSIGLNTLRVIRQHADKLELIAVSAHRHSDQLARICQEFGVPNAVMTDEAAGRDAIARQNFPPTTQLSVGSSALRAICQLEAADCVLVAVVGACGLMPALAAIDAGKDLLLANKELLVMGGALVIEAAQKKGVQLLPVDSEHNAIFQCLQGCQRSEVDQLILTASGGQFRDWPIEQLEQVTPRAATQHPNWKMGPKITVDSATMANKGLELIEAHWLFGLNSERLKVVIHPQSIVHSCVQLIDGSILAQMSPPSMTFAIQHCLLYPERAAAPEATLDFTQTIQFEFHPPELKRYPCLELAYTALRQGGSAPVIYNAANEVAVAQFLKQQIPFLRIPEIIEKSLHQVGNSPIHCLETLYEVDAAARQCAQQLAS